MRRPDPKWSILIVLVAALAGCSDSNDVTQPSNEDIQIEVQAVAEAVAETEPTAAVAGDLVLGLMSQLTTGPAAMTTGDLSPAIGPPDCPAEFDLENGITGTCAVSEEGVVTFTFGGTVATDGGEAQLEGTMVAAPAANQPETGMRYTIDLDASATSPAGTATWSAFGTVTVDDSGAVVDFSINLTHTLQGNVGTGALVNVVISPSSFTMVATGPRGNVLSFDFDRETMSGVVTVNGVQVATVELVEGCAFVDYMNTTIPDETVCPD